MIHVLDNLCIPENEITFAASRSGGPGGQNVNKVSSRVTLTFDVNGSAALSGDQKRKILDALATRINKEGLLRVVSQRTRSQDMNRTDATERFADLLRRALMPRQPRVKTHVPAAAKEHRLELKRKRMMIKQTRSKRGWD